MSTLEVDSIVAATSNTDLTITGAGTGRPNLQTGTKLNGTALGTAATLDAGTGANNLVQLDGSGNLPAVDGSALTGIAAGFTLATPQATTSGTSFTFGSIPAGTTVIHVNFVGVSTNGTQELQLRIGDAGGVETSGYTSTSASIAATTNSMDSDGGAFKVGSSNAAADSIHGTMILSLENAATFTWCSMGMLQSVYGSAMEISAGSKSLSAELTQLYLWAANDTFDAGAINISYM